MADIVERLDLWCTDWNGAKLVREEAPRDGLLCGDLMDARDTIESLRDEVRRLREAGENMAREVCTCDTSGSVSEALRKWNEALRD